MPTSPATRVVVMNTFHVEWTAATSAVDDSSTRDAKTISVVLTGSSQLINRTVDVEYK